MELAEGSRFVLCFIWQRFGQVVRAGALDVGMSIKERVSKRYPFFVPV